MTRKLLFVVVVLLVSSNLFAQDDWWKETHGWEPGMPGWRTFMEISPGYLGVNALPIPYQYRGEIPLKSEVEIATDFHFAEGETAQNLFFRYLQSYAEGRVAIEFYGFPFEHYRTTPEVRDFRRSIVYEAEGSSFGDIYFASHMKVFKEGKYMPSMVFRIAGKTAPGELFDARWTDTPAYFLDLSAGKDFEVNEQIKLRAYGMIGFYCWQTTDDVFLQNDAFLWGAGVELESDRWRFDISSQGYSGWMKNLDCPANNRYSFAYSLKHFDLKLEYQQGWRDVLYNSFRTAAVYKF